MPAEEEDIKLLQSVYDIASNNGRSIDKLVDRVGQQNHRIDKLEFAAERERGVQEERLKWEKIEADRRDKQISNLWRVLGFGLTGAGLLSGAIFGSIQAAILLF